MKPRPIAVASAGAFVSAMSTSLVAVSTPVIAKDLHVVPADVSWVLTAYLLAGSCLLALAGRSADMIGRRRVYLTGFVFFIAGSMACAIAPTLPVLVGARVVQGAGGAMLMAVGPAIVTRAVPPERRARSLGVQLAATYIGLMLGPGIGGILSAAIGWHAVFFVIAAAGTLSAAFAIALLPADEAPPERPSIATLDLTGAALFAAGLAAVLYALKRTHEDGWTGRTVLAIGAFGLISLAIFARHEASHPTPLLPLALFRSRPFAYGVLGAMLLYTIQFMLSYLLPFELQHEGGLGPAQAGAFMTSQPAAMALVAPISGIIADRSGPRIPSTAGMIAIGSGMVAIATTASHPSAWLVLALALVGVGAGLYVAPNTALIMGAAPRDRQSIAGAMVATARNLGMTLGIAVAASLDAALGFRGAVLVASALAAAGALLGAVRPIVTSSARSS